MTLGLSKTAAKAVFAGSGATGVIAAARGANEAFATLLRMKECYELSEFPSLMRFCMRLNEPNLTVATSSLLAAAFFLTLSVAGFWNLARLRRGNDSEKSG